MPFRVQPPKFSAEPLVILGHSDLGTGNLGPFLLKNPVVSRCGFPGHGVEDPQTAGCKGQPPTGQILSGYLAGKWMLSFSIWYGMMMYSVLVSTTLPYTPSPTIWKRTNRSLEIRKTFCQPLQRFNAVSGILHAPHAIFTTIEHLRGFVRQLPSMLDLGIHHNSIEVGDVTGIWGNWFGLMFTDLHRTPFFRCWLWHLLSQDSTERIHQGRFLQYRCPMAFQSMQSKSPKFMGPATTWLHNPSQLHHFESLDSPLSSTFILVGL